MFRPLALACASCLVPPTLAWTPGLAPAFAESIAARDDAPRTAAEALDRVRQAVGYDRLAVHPGGIHATGTSTLAGLDCTYSLLFAGDRQCVQRHDGPISIAAALDGDTVWIADIGGEVRAVSHSDSERAMIGLLMVTPGYLADSSPLDFQLAPSATRSTPATSDASAPDSADAAAHFPLAFRMLDGEMSGTLHLDRETWLPASWSYTEGPNLNTVTLGDHRDFDGLKLPGSIVTLGGSGFGSTVTIENIADAPTFVRSPYEMPPAAGGLGDIAFDPQVSATLEIVKAPTGHLLVHPLVNGKDVGWFIFDTGAGYGVLSTPVAAELGLESFGELPATGVGGVTKASLCRPQSLTLGPMTMRDPLMVNLDLSFLEQYMGRRIAGLVGYSLLMRSVAHIDMLAPAISLHDPATFDDPTIPWQRLVIDQRVPHVEAAFEDHAGLFRLDTGAAQMSVSMHAPAVERLNLLAGRETVSAMAGGVGGMVPVKRGSLAWFELGGLRTENVSAEFATQAVGAFADPYSLGNIGGVLLQPFVLVTDYPHNRIAFVRRN